MGWNAMWRKIVSMGGALGLACALVGALGASCASAQARAVQASSCNQACLKSFADQYIEALARHDPSRLRVAKMVRFTENGAALKLGEGLWVTFEHAGPYRHDFYDPSTGGVGLFFSATENGFPDLVSLRLKVVDHKITEVETIISRNSRNAANLPPKDPSWMEVFDRVEPASKRLTREQLIQGTIGYMRSIAFKKGDLAPFAES